MCERSKNCVQVNLGSTLVSEKSAQKYVGVADQLEYEAVRVLREGTEDSTESINYVG